MRAVSLFLSPSRFAIHSFISTRGANKSTMTDDFMYVRIIARCVNRLTAEGVMRGFVILFSRRRAWRRGRENRGRCPFKFLNDFITCASRKLVELRRFRTSHVACRIAKAMSSLRDRDRAARFALHLRREESRGS